MEKGISIDVMMAINKVVGPDYIPPYIHTVDYTSYVLSWSLSQSYLEVEVMDCGADGCECFRWFYVKDNFSQGTIGFECANDISEEFEKVLKRSIKLKL